ncbi:MAG: DUF2852 domain-containing protein [Janthinobacterium lividum]
MISKIDEYGKVGWITATVVSFWLAWPIGLAMLAFLAGSGRLRGFSASAPGTWFNLGTQDNRWNAGFKAPWGHAKSATSGNKAFDEYRDETLRRLEDEEREFQSFLDRLRKARDKSEFDSFMAERRNRPAQDVSNAA